MKSVDVRGFAGHDANFDAHIVENASYTLPSSILCGNRAEAAELTETDERDEGAQKALASSTRSLK